ncbi:hypothetical protein D3C81_178870 [compost metagenome]
MPNSRIHEGNVTNNYAAYALGATRQEQQGNYEQAQVLWSKAAQSVCSAARQHWAENRCAFCANAAARGWQQRKSPAARFNAMHPAGTRFYHGADVQHGEGKIVRTIDLARDGINGAFVEIAQEPGIANIKYLTPAL